VSLAKGGGIRWTLVSYRVLTDCPLPTAQEIAIDVSRIPDYTPIAELAKSACVVSGMMHPYDRRMVGGIELPAWQAKICEAQFMILLAGSPMSEAFNVAARSQIRFHPLVNGDTIPQATKVCIRTYLEAAKLDADRVSPISARRWIDEQLEALERWK
jgi:hypothetical protein